MDNTQIRARVAQNGPQLIHWVARVPDIAGTVQTLAAQGIDRGAAIEASRMTPSGLLQWQITLRDDGQRLFDGCLPTLIQWGDVHPTDNMQGSDVTLQALHIAASRCEPIAGGFGGHRHRRNCGAQRVSPHHCHLSDPPRHCKNLVVSYGHSRATTVQVWFGALFVKRSTFNAALLRSACGR